MGRAHRCFTSPTGIRPSTRAGRLSRLRCTRLAGAIRATLEDALAAGGSALVSPTALWAQARTPLLIEGMATVFALLGLALSYYLARHIRFGGWVMRLVLAGIAVSTTEKAWPAFGHSGLHYLFSTEWNPGAGRFGAGVWVPDDQNEIISWWPSCAAGGSAR